MLKVDPVSQVKASQELPRLKLTSQDFTDFISLFTLTHILVKQCFPQVLRHILSYALNRCMAIVNLDLVVKVKFPKRRD